MDIATAEFGSLNPGDGFIYNNVVYIKADPTTGITALNPKDGSQAAGLSGPVVVTPTVNAKIQL